MAKKTDLKKVNLGDLDKDAKKEITNHIEQLVKIFDKTKLIYLDIKISGVEKTKVKVDYFLAG